LKEYTFSVLPSHPTTSQFITSEEVEWMIHMQGGSVLDFDATTRMKPSAKALVISMQFRLQTSMNSQTSGKK
jgi:ethanolamine utilization cobalamin adenosyltransferase